MKIAILSAASAIHTIRWCNGLASLDHEIFLISAHKLLEPLASNIKYYQLSNKAPLGYYTNSHELKKILRQIKPEILNVHFASGYGTLGRLSGFTPLLLSVWGSDVYDFPEKSVLHKWIVSRNIREADAIASTSYCMLEVTQRLYNHNKTFITPFGIDVKEFYSQKKEDPSDFIYGTVKTLSYKYGIDTLIRAFKIVIDSSGGDKPFLEITGDGPDRNKLENLAENLGIKDQVRFIGMKQHEEVAEQLHRMDVYVALSRLDSESFGVAILEASACGLPVIVSDVDGLKEVTRHMETGIVVPRESPEKAAQAMLKLAGDKKLRKRLGDNGRNLVNEKYTWDYSLESMITAYICTII